MYCLKHPLTLSTIAHSQILTLYQDQVCDWHTNLATPTHFCFNTDLVTVIHLFLLICYELNIDAGQHTVCLNHCSPAALSSTSLLT